MNGIEYLLQRFFAATRRETGAVAAEHGLILALVVLVTILAITAFGIAVSDLYTRGAGPFPSP